jgi:hypothetical protein
MIGLGLLITNVGGMKFGPELFIDGAFDVAGSHTIQSEMSISGGRLNYTATTASRTSAQNPNLLAVAGKRYRLMLTVASYTAGNCRMNFGGVTGTLRSAAGSYIQDILATTNGASALIGLTGSTLSIDNVSIREIL